MKHKLLSLLISSLIALSLVPTVLAEEVTVYDDIKFTNTCETEADGLILSDGAPDGSKYYTYTADNTGEYTELGGLGADTSEDYMWEADVRFDEALSGFTIKSASSKTPVDTCIRRYDTSGKTLLSVQTGGSKYSAYTEIDTNCWYHIQIIGQYGTTMPLRMVIYKWENGEKVLIGEYTDINKRNNSPASYISIEPGTSIDNIQITKIGPDSLTISTVPEDVHEINAGSGIPLRLNATRSGQAVNKPAVEWKIYENGEEISDKNINITATGILSVSLGCTEKDILIKAVSMELGNAEAEYEFHINGADFESEKFDKILLSADKDYVNFKEPLELNVLTSKNNEDVVPESGDIVWKIYDPNNLQELGNKFITIKNNCLYVTKQVIPQNIIVSAQSESGFVSAYIPVSVTDISLDTLLISESCEDVYNYSITPDSWDDSHFYNITASTSMADVGNITEEIIIEMDVRFSQENSGFKLRSSDGYEGGQIARQGTKIGNISSGNRFTAITDGDAESWYHIKLTVNCNPDNYYANASIYQYSASGSLKKLEENFTLNMRTMEVELSPFSYIDIMSGTQIDNLKITRLLPDTIKLDLAKTAEAGNTVSAKVTLTHAGVEMTNFDTSKLTWEIYDEYNLSLSDDVSITVNSDGLITIDSSSTDKTVYIRVTLEENGIYASAPLSVTGKEIFTVTGIGTNSTSTIITELKISMNTEYSGNVMFIVAVYDENGLLADVSIVNTDADTLKIGVNTLKIDSVELPENFTNVKVMAWTGM